MITSFNCPCGNTDPSKAKMYNGMLGYEAMICTECGRYSDHNGSHSCDKWSAVYIVDMGFETACKLARAEIRATPEINDLTILETANKYAEFIMEDLGDFNNCSEAIICELQEEFPQL